MNRHDIVHHFVSGTNFIENYSSQNFITMGYAGKTDKVGAELDLSKDMATHSRVILHWTVTDEI